MVITVYICGIVWPAGQVWWTKHVPLWAIIGIFLQIPTKWAGDMLCSVHITKILHRCDVMSFHDMMTSLMTSSPVHVWQVT